MRKRGGGLPALEINTWWGGCGLRGALLLLWAVQCVQSLLHGWMHRQSNLTLEGGTGVQCGTRGFAVTKFLFQKAEVAQVCCLSKRVAQLRVQLKRLLQVGARRSVVTFIHGNKAEVA